MSTYFSGGLRSGSDPSEGSDAGFVRLEQSFLLTTNNATAVNMTEVLPAGAQITGITIDKVVQHAGGTATTLTAQVGNIVGGVAYIAPVDIFGTARLSPAYTVANLAAMQDIGQNRNVVLTLTPNGTFTTQAVIRMSVAYLNKI